MPERQPRTPAQGSRDEPRQIDGAGGEGFEIRAWHWLAFVVLGLAVVLLLARKRLAGAIAAKPSAARQTAPQPSNRAPDMAGLLSQLQTACAANDARAAALALLELGRSAQQPRGTGAAAWRRSRNRHGARPRALRGRHVDLGRRQAVAPGQRVLAQRRIATETGSRGPRPAIPPAQLTACPLTRHHGESHVRNAA